MTGAVNEKHNATVKKPPSKPDFRANLPTNQTDIRSTRHHLCHRFDHTLARLIADYTYIDASAVPLTSAESPGDVIFSSRVTRLEEKRLSLVYLDKPAGMVNAAQHKCRDVGNARRLLHIVRHRNDRVPLR